MTEMFEKNTSDDSLAAPSMKKCSTKGMKRKASKEQKITSFFLCSKRPPESINDSPPLYGRDKEDVVYDRYIASRTDSDIFSAPASSSCMRFSDDMNKSYSPTRKVAGNVDDDFYFSMRKNSKFRNTASTLTTIRCDFSPRSAKFELAPKRKLSFHTPHKKPITRFADPFGFVPMSNLRLCRSLFASTNTRRHIDCSPYRTLDAPGLCDNFYYSLLSWSSRNEIAVALSKAVYLYEVSSQETRALFEQDEGEPEVTSLAWDPLGRRLAVGFASGRVELWATEKSELERTLPPHTARVGCISWCGSLLATGGKDRAVLVFDVRTSLKEGGVRLMSHKQEVCGLKWSYSEANTLASGGNDNKLLVWDFLSRSVVKEYSEHEAAVRAIDWSPHKPGLLASGGGTNDNTIRFWDTTTGEGKSISKIDSKSQVCSLLWSKNSDEFVSTHGYSKYWIKVYQYATKPRRLEKFQGHSGRILHLSMSPDGTSIATGSGDETLKFWKIFPEPKDPVMKLATRKSRMKLPDLR